jgi:hypothetical protein
VAFQSTDPAGTLPQNYTFTVADHGVHTFTGLVLRTRCRQTLTVVDASAATVEGSFAIDIL